MKLSSRFSEVLSLSMLFVVVGCTKPDSGDPIDNLSDPSAKLERFRTSCGTIFKSEEQNPIDADDARRGGATVVGPNLISLSLSRGTILVKLHGVDVPDDNETQSAAEAWLRSLVAQGDVYFYPAEPDCTTVLDDGTEGAVGAVFSAKGQSFSETLLKKGLGRATSDVCNGTKLVTCYRALVEEVAPTPTPVVEFQGPANAAGFILWKPVSDSNGKLAVHSVPYGTEVVVDGETGRNQGPGNGYGSLARFRKPGCGYGNSVKLELVLSDGSNFMFGTKDYAVIPDGCKRYVIDKNGKAKLNKK